MPARRGRRGLVVAAFIDLAGADPLAGPPGRCRAGADGLAHGHRIALVRPEGEKGGEGQPPLIDEDRAARDAQGQ